MRADVILECRAEAAGVARRFVVGALASWGLRGEAGGTTVSEVTLVASELVGNAVKASDTPIVLTVAVDDRIRVAVRDHSPEPAAMLPPDPYAPGGRGLAIVTALSTHWGQNRHGGHQVGKVIWAERAIPEHSALPGRGSPEPLLHPGS